MCRTFAVIASESKDEEEVYTVPHCWVTFDKDQIKCGWPPYKINSKQFRQCVQDHDIPVFNTGDRIAARLCWTQYVVKRILYTSASYLDCRQKENEAQYASDVGVVNSEVDDGLLIPEADGRRKSVRKRKERKHSSSAVESDCESESDNNNIVSLSKKSQFVNKNVTLPQPPDPPLSLVPVSSEVSSLGASQVLPRGSLNGLGLQNERTTQNIVSSEQPSQSVDPPLLCLRPQEHTYHTPTVLGCTSDTSEHDLRLSPPADFHSELTRKLLPPQQLFRNSQAFPVSNVSRQWSPLQYQYQPQHPAVDNFRSTPSTAEASGSHQLMNVHTPVHSNTNVLVNQRVFQILEGLKNTCESNSTKLDRLLAANVAKAHTKYPGDWPHLPLSTISEVESLNELLLREPGNRELLVRFLSVIGGTDTDDAVSRLLYKLFSIPVGRQMNWSGVAGKRCFQKLEFPSVVLDTVTRAGVGITAASVETSIKKWLKRASDREGGREQRRKKAEAKNQYSSAAQ